VCAIWPVLHLQLSGWHYAHILGFKLVLVYAFNIALGVGFDLVLVAAMLRLIGRSRVLRRGPEALEFGPDRVEQVACVRIVEVVLEWQVLPQHHDADEECHVRWHMAVLQIDVNTFAELAEVVLLAQPSPAII
jgi:hypothetical protein